MSDEAARLLSPECFPELRALLFRDARGREYVTPKHQLAWWWLLAAVALKVKVPDWVEDWYEEQGTDLGINEWTDIDWDSVDFSEERGKMFTVWLLAPPRHGKTELIRHAMLILTLINPNIRMVFVSINEPIAELTTGWLKREFETNETLIAMYGPFVKDGEWSDKKFTVATRTQNLASPTVVALGKRGGAVSRDADLIVIDDPVDIDSSESPTQIERDARRIRSNILTRREPWTPVIGIGSHQASPMGDMYEHMEGEADATGTAADHVVVKFVKLKAHRYDHCRPGETDDQKHGAWCLLWPEYRPFWFLEGIRHDIGDVMFEVTYNQESRSGGIEYFPEKMLRSQFPTPVYDNELQRFRDPDVLHGRDIGIQDVNRSFGEFPACCNQPPEKLLTAIGFDPAAGSSRKAAETALVVLAACQYCYRRYVIDIYHERINSATHPEIIEKYARSYGAKRVRIENNAYQKSLIDNKELRGYSISSQFLIEEWQTDQKRLDPELGIPFLSRDMHAGLFSVPYRHPMDKQKAEALIRQIARFPRTPNDLVFALWLAHMSVTGLLDEVKYATPTRQRDFEDLPQYLKDQVITVNLGDVRRTGI